MMGLGIPPLKAKGRATTALSLELLWKVFALATILSLWEASNHRFLNATSTYPRDGDRSLCHRSRDLK
jgi:hypothetical protein